REPFLEGWQAVAEFLRAANAAAPAKSQKPVQPPRGPTRAPPRRDAHRDGTDRSRTQCYHPWVVEFRRHPRVPFEGSVEFGRKGGSDRVAGECKDVSLGGMYVQTPNPMPFGAELFLYVTFPGGSAPFAI